MEHLSLEAFTQQLCSKAPAPGGGGVSALAGALGAALGAMAANLTVGKKTYADVQTCMQESAERLTSLSKEFLKGVQADADAFTPLAKAYGMPKDTEEEKQAKERVLQHALYQAAQPPLQVLNRCVQTLEVLEQLHDKASRLVVSDVGCGAALCWACAHTAAMNVYINAGMLTDEMRRRTIMQECQTGLEQACRTAERIIQAVEETLCPNF